MRTVLHQQFCWHILSVTSTKCGPHGQHFHMQHIHNMSMFLRHISGMYPSANFTYTNYSRNILQLSKLEHLHTCESLDCIITWRLVSVIHNLFNIFLNEHLHILTLLWHHLKNVPNTLHPGPIHKCWQVVEFSSFLGVGGPLNFNLLHLNFVRLLRIVVGGSSILNHLLKFLQLSFDNCCGLCLWRSNLNYLRCCVVSRWVLCNFNCTRFHFHLHRLYGVSKTLL